MATWFSVITHMELLRKFLAFFSLMLFVFQEQQRRHLAVTIVPIASYAPENRALFINFSLDESLNH